jgi:hypothetical protein
MGLSRTQILLLILALIGTGMLVRQPPAPPRSLSRRDDSMPGVRRGRRSRSALRSPLNLPPNVLPAIRCATGAR